ncbi:hypothetical protein F0U62_28145 [Cystobacter fuscus]|uniref:hypothetical protein n=1 Tax=Cystobacter fuscus TaxID=43 RepID=UPI002B2FF486|nr:hypothetical protein F0U62_28145 [Cystobacter fuscus]
MLPARILLETLNVREKQFRDWRIEGLEQVLVVKNGNVTPLILPKKPATGMTPKGYPDQRE